MTPKKGDYILLGKLYAGVVLDVYWNDARDDYICKLYLVKNAFQRNQVELHCKDTLAGEIEPCGRERIVSEINQRMKSLHQKLQENFDAKKS